MAHASVGDAGAEHEATQSWHAADARERLILDPGSHDTAEATLPDRREHDIPVPGRERSADSNRVRGSIDSIEPRYFRRTTTNATCAAEALYELMPGIEAYRPRNELLSVGERHFGRALGRSEPRGQARARALRLALEKERRAMPLVDAADRLGIACHVGQSYALCEFIVALEARGVLRVHPSLVQSQRASGERAARPTRPPATPRGLASLDSTSARSDRIVPGKTA